MTAQQKQIGEAFRVRSYFNGGMGAVPITTVIGSGLMTTGSLLAATGVGVLPGAIVSAVGAMTSLIGGLFQPNITNIQATRIVDDIELRVLKPTLASWQSLPAAQKTRAMQSAHSMVVEKALSDVMQGCSNPQLGESGRRCISERLVRGGSAPWCPTGTGCDWIATYLDPIANDPNVIPDSTVGGTVGGAVSGAMSELSSTFGISPMLLGLGLVGIALVAVSD